MKKPVIILADTDYGYLEALEIKYIERFGSQIEMEVITEPAYFAAFFSVQREADVLVVSEDLYNDELKKHDIAKIVILGEDIRQAAFNDGTVYVDKYSNLKDIVNESTYDLVLKKTESGKLGGQPKIVTVCSASGGAGVTTVALGLCRSLAERHKRVLYLNSESMQYFHYYLNDRVCLDTEACRLMRQAGPNLYGAVRAFIRTEGFSFLPPLPAAAELLQISPETYRKLAEQAKESGEYDYIVVDTENVCSVSASALIARSDCVLIIMRQDEISVEKTKILEQNMDCSDKEKFMFVCNCYDTAQESALKKNNGGRYISAYIRKITGRVTLEALEKSEGIESLTYLLL